MNNLLSACRHVSLISNHKISTQVGGTLKLSYILYKHDCQHLGIRAKDLLAFRLELVRTMLDTVGGVRAVSNAHVDTAQNEGVCCVERLCDIGLKSIVDCEMKEFIEKTFPIKVIGSTKLIRSIYTTHEFVISR